MSASGGIAPIHISLSNATQSLVSLFNGAQSLRGTIVNHGGGLALLLAGARVSLPENATLMPGQVVDAVLVQSESGKSIRIQPRPRPGTATSASTQNPISRLIASALHDLGIPSRSASAAHRVLGQDIPMTAASIRNVLNLFASRGNISSDLIAVVRLANAAASAGVLSPEMAKTLSEISRASTVRSENTIFEAMVLSRKTIADPLEAKIANTFMRGEIRDSAGLRAELQALLAGLRDDADFEVFLRKSGGLAEFRETMGRLQERIEGVHLQNLAGADHPYLFLEVPVALDGFEESVFVHVFGNGEGSPGDFEDGASIVIDVSLTRLGDLWIAVQVSEKRCTCRIMATAPETVSTLRNESDRLAQVLSQIGLNRVSVEVVLWDGDRLRETGEQMRRFSGLDVVV